MFQNKFPRLEILSPDAIETIDRGWRRIVSEIGVEFLHDKAIELFRSAGQRIEGDVVRFDPDFLMEKVQLAPSSFEVQARNPSHSLVIGGDTMTFVPIYGAPFIREGSTRSTATMADFERLVRLSQSFDEIDSPGGVICEPDDRPLDSRHLDMLLSLLTSSDKPFFASVVT